MADPIVGTCWHCGHSLRTVDLGRETTCLGCGKATRCCRNCRFFSPGKPDDCSETIVEAVSDKTRANFCEFFEPTNRPLSDALVQSHAADLLKAAQDLFK